jgi:hypothetical protein
MSKFIEIAQQWRARGGGPCEHRRTSKEYYLGSQTGDRGCLECGETWPMAEDPPRRAQDAEALDGR